MTERQRAILEAVLDDDPGQQCAGCGDSAVDDWHIARRGPWLDHGSGGKRCRFPCELEPGEAPCRHTDCVEVRTALRRRRKAMPSKADPGQTSMASLIGTTQNDPKRIQTGLL